MERKREPTPWMILELSILLDSKDFQDYCAAHPEEVQAARNLLLSREIM
jgi:hypothetical protein